MKVKLRNPDRIEEVSGPKTVAQLLARLEIVPEAVLVIRDAGGSDAMLLTRDEALSEGDEIEVRPVLSGGSGQFPEILFQWMQTADISRFPSTRSRSGREAEEGGRQ